MVRRHARVTPLKARFHKPLKGHPTMTKDLQAAPLPVKGSVTLPVTSLEDQASNT